MRWLVVYLLAMPAAAAAQAPVEYFVSFANAVHHEAQITVVWTELGPAPLEVRMSRSSPGRYALHEFARNVYGLEFADGRGRPLTAARPNAYQWNVAGHDGTVRATYTLYGDRIDGTYAAIDLTHARLNAPATFLWARGLDARPVRVTFAPLPGWRIATQLIPTADSLTLAAPDLQYFMDSPIELSDFAQRSWQVETHGKTQTLYLIVHHAGSDQDVDALLDAVRAIVATESGIFGELPEFDHGEYRFILDYLPYAQDDGMEHRNSTVISAPQQLDVADLGGHLGSIAHEFFHVWNVERMRPREIEPFDFEHANTTPNLWFAEGFTSYYDTLVVRRARQTTVSQYLAGLAELIDAVTAAPGRRIASPQDMSLQAPLFDGAVSMDASNRANSFLTYYVYGAAVGLALDLSLRSRFDGVTLDTFMQRMWRLHGSPETAYSPDDLRSVLAETTGDRAYADDFFARFVSGRELPDYGALLAKAGLLVRRAHAGVASVGPETFSFEDGSALIVANTVIGTPLYGAGLDRGDSILALDRTVILGPRDWARAMKRYAPGDTATVRFLQRGTERTAQLTFMEDPRIEVVTYESADQELSGAQRAFRTSWLGSE